MRSSATSTLTEHRFRGVRGFTLIELLVVLVLIGVITTFAVINISGTEDPRLEREARRLAAVLELAAESAVIQGRELGLVLDGEGYRFARLEAGEWMAFGAEGDRVFRPHELPDDIRMEWVTDGLPGEREPGGDDDAPVPNVMLLSSGEATPFRLALTWRGRGDTAGWLLEVGQMGHIRLQQDEDPVP